MSQSDKENDNLAINPGDRVKEESQTVEEKSDQVAVDSWDVTGHVTVPTYFVAEGEEGEKEALHHVKDAEEISDVIREARVDEDGNRTWC
ncbi:hypothetical protein IQ249_10940 [Lusitaniella coriacea LEGE 07157]|uniref:Uncharacterized protein n=1 Tax=Lusitaniella coriacea LEGE 07157 TaxID=945747 RepID=A0A8J7JAP5_9CYAN|nr:hypothetical protein [Lusitaniella coriacea]MBE9116415.1 hypothetical protein [Lusitaniella coriacea LEGE 07157]